MLGMQKEEANQEFAKYIAKNYLDWVSPDNRDRHLMSPDIFKRKIFPLLDEGKKVFLIVIDNFRYDQWRMLAEDIGDLFDIDEQALHEHSSYRHAICAQRHLQRSDAEQDSRNVP